MKKIHVYTSAACNYIPKVRTLVQSIRKFHPDWVVHLALSDEVPPGLDLSNEPFDQIHPLSDLGIPSSRGWAFCHTIVELSTAIKPFLLARLLERDDCGGVVYLDPDTVLFSRLDDVVQALEHSNLALTPHLIAPEASLSAIMDNEISCLRHGTYNLGFLAVAPTQVGKAFAGWWSDRLYHFCRAEIPNGLFTDQRWIDLVPAMFEGVCILRTPRLNVAPWNLSTRLLTGDLPDGIMVDGQPLGFYHFTGFDSGAHCAMVGKYAGDQATVKALIDWYREAVRAFGDDPLSEAVWAYSRYADGSAVSTVARFVYRERLDLQRAFPDPFATEGGGYKGWWVTQGVIEYPALFDEDPDVVLVALERLSASLTPGYRGREVTIAACAGGLSKLSAPLMPAGPVSLPESSNQPAIVSRKGARYAKRVWEVLRREGLGWLVRRLSS